MLGVGGGQRDRVEAEEKDFLKNYKSLRDSGKLGKVRLSALMSHSPKQQREFSSGYLCRSLESRSCGRPPPQQVLSGAQRPYPF